VPDDFGCCDLDGVAAAFYLIVQGMIALSQCGHQQLVGSELVRSETPDLFVVAGQSVIAIEFYFHCRASIR